MAAPRTYPSPPPPHALYYNPSFFLPPQMLAYHWHSPPPQAPTIPHKVWILDCTSCATFITNRAMKAVLLLRPNVSLFSSDALPTNCSPYTTNPVTLRSPSSAPHPSRTCECLTQTLCCHGCGGAIGYMIVIPCTRCTSSITATNRATNGHRFVFHSSQVVSTERYYIPDEPGVIPYEPPSTPMTPESINQASLYSSIYRNYIDPRDYPPSRSQSPYASDYLPTPPLELANPTLESSATPAIDAFPFPRGHHNYSTSEPHLSPNTPGLHPPLFFPHPLSRSQRPSVPSHSTHHLINRSFSAVASRPSSTSPPPLIYSPFPLGIPSEQKELPLPRKLQAGDTLYWHHLAKTGEIPGVEDDQRARENPKPKAPGGKLSAPLSFDR